MKIGNVEVKFCLMESIKFLFVFPTFITPIQVKFYVRSAFNAVHYLGYSWKWAQGNPFFCYGPKYI
jgi:hypothetical protein